MNERIRELAFQAMSINQKVSDDSFFVEVSKLNEFEKFAELIVRECANEIVEMTEKYATFNGNVRRHIMHSAISEKLKEHFGVE